jgi:hypothetical protein
VDIEKEKLVAAEIAKIWVFVETEHCGGQWTDWQDYDRLKMVIQGDFELPLQRMSAAGLAYLSEQAQAHWDELHRVPLAWSGTE